jgi:hypothetical protein
MVKQCSKIFDFWHAVNAKRLPASHTEKKTCIREANGVPFGFAK